MSHKQQVARQRGFTVIELTIATLVFSMILLVMTAGVLRFTKQYYKGVISNQTQNTARTIIDDITRSIQFNSGDIARLTTNDPSVAPDPDPAARAYGYCIGESKRYSFSQNHQVKDTGPRTSRQKEFGLIADTTTGCSPSTLAINTDTITDLPTPPASVNPRELLGDQMRISKLSITKDADIFTITVRVVYGEDDLLCSPSAPGNECAAGNTAAPASLDDAEDLSCRNDIGVAYCAVSELTTSVKERVQ